MEFSARDHAWLYGVLAQEIRRARPDDFPALLRNAVIACGVQRGRRMGQAADESGFPRSMLAYLACGELPDFSGESQVRVPQTDPVVWLVTACPWQLEWARCGMTDVGRFYCRFIDRALVRGFNPRLELSTGDILTAGGDGCYFRWNGASLSGSGREQFDAMTRAARPLCRKPWAYHLAHLYKAVGEVLDAMAGPAVRRAVFDAADARIAHRFGSQPLALLHAGLAVDFTVNAPPADCFQP